MKEGFWLIYQKNRWLASKQFSDDSSEGSNAIAHLRNMLRSRVECDRVSVQATLLEGALEATGKDMKRDGGINLLEGGDHESATNFFDQLERYGLFVARKGELESWLLHLGIDGKGSQWLARIFECMKENTSDPDYVMPSYDDVWQFISTIRKWAVNEKRLGIPNS